MLNINLKASCWRLVILPDILLAATIPAVIIKRQIFPHQSEALFLMRCRCKCDENKGEDKNLN